MSEHLDAAIEEISKAKRAVVANDALGAVIGAVNHLAGAVQLLERRAAGGGTERLEGAGDEDDDPAGRMPSGHPDGWA